MPLVPAKCTVCGAVLSIESTKEAAVCQSCGNAFVVENAINNYNTYNNTVNNITADTVIVNAESEKEQLYRNAETFRKLGRYEKAKSYYDNLVKDYSDDWRGWWGLILCETEDFTVLSKEERTSYLFSVVQKLVPADQTEAVLNNYKVYLQTASELAAEDDLEKVRGLLDGDSIETDPTVFSFNSQLKNIEQNCQLNMKNQDAVVAEKEELCNKTNAEIQRYENLLKRCKTLLYSGIIALIVGCFVLFVWAPANLNAHMDNGASPLGVIFTIMTPLIWGVITLITIPYAKKKNNSEIENLQRILSANKKLLLEEKSKRTQWKQNYDEQKAAVEQEKLLYIEQRTAQHTERIMLYNEYIAFGKERLAAYHFGSRCRRANIPAETDESVELLRSRLFEK